MTDDNIFNNLPKKGGRRLWVKWVAVFVWAFPVVLLGGGVLWWVLDSANTGALFITVIGSFLLGQRMQLYFAEP